MPPLPWAISQARLTAQGTCPKKRSAAHTTEVQNTLRQWPSKQSVSVALQPHPSNSNCAWNVSQTLSQPWPTGCTAFAALPCGLPLLPAQAWALDLRALRRFSTSGAYTDPWGHTRALICMYPFAHPCRSLRLAPFPQEPPVGRAVEHVTPNSQLTVAGSNPEVVPGVQLLPPNTPEDPMVRTRGLTAVGKHA